MGYPWSNGQFLTAPDLNAEFAAVIALTNTRSISTTDYGTVGNGLADDTAALQAGIDAAIALQLPLYIPPGRYLISAPLVITRGIRICGAYVEPLTAMFGTPTSPPGNGTWIVLDGTHLVSAFFVNPGGTPSASNQTMGVEIDHIGFQHNQPTPAGGWAPRAYPPAIDIPAGSDVYLHDLFMLSPTVAIRAAGQSAGRLTIERVSGQPLQQGIVLDNQTDTVVVRDVHFWSYWSLDTNVLAYQRTNAVGVQLGRVDDPVFENFFCLWYWVGAQISATANGPTTAARFIGCDFNVCGNPFVINDAIGGNSAYLSGCILDGTHDATSTSALTIAGGGASSVVLLSSCLLGNVGNSCVSILSGANQVRLTSCNLAQWDIRNVGNAALSAGASGVIRADASCVSFSLNSNTLVCSGAASTRTPVQWLSHGTMLAAGTSVTLPHLLGTTPDMMLVTPNADPGSATKWWVTGTGTDITVHVNAAPGGNVPFSVLLGLDVFR